MHTRSKTRADQIQVPTRSVLEGPATRSSTDVEDDLGLGSLTDDGAGAAVGGSRPEVGAATSQPGNDPVRPEDLLHDVPVACEWVPTREPVAKYATIPTLAVETPIPTLFSYGPGAQVEPENWSPHVQKFDKTRAVVRNYRDYDDYDRMHYDENIDMFDQNVVSHPVYGDRQRFSSFHSPVASPAIPDVWDRPRTFLPISRNHGGMSCDLPRSQEPRPKSPGSSRATSRVSGVNLDWLGDYEKVRRRCQ